LIASSLGAFSLIAWAAIVWTTLIPGARATAHVLAQRAQSAITALRDGAPLPEGITAISGPRPQTRRLPAFGFSFYLLNLRHQLEADLPGSDIVVARSVMPSQIWVRPPGMPDQWLVLRWQVARPETPVALLLVILSGALLTLVGAAVFARRLTAPLADLVAATTRVAEGERVKFDSTTGPSEVRSLALAFRSMSHRLGELDEQRELMLAGLSHDLRSPLARMRVAVELLDARDGALADQMKLEVQEMDRVIGQFLHYVRAAYRESPVEACVDEVIRASLAPYDTDTRLRFELNATQMRPCAVETMRHILLNLVENAFEYGQPPVTVRSRLTPSDFCLSVEDGGTGLTEQQWQEAIRPFRRLRSAPGSGHTGLGLAMVDRLARACAGTLTARRATRGFVVEVTIPTTGPALQTGNLAP
jgi:two-component system osmolarity sensor histidine kinase EnvZ